MAKSGKGGPDRLLVRRGLTWWVKIEIPKDCRALLGNKTALPMNTETGDIRLARPMRDAFEATSKSTFAAIRAGTYDPQQKVATAAQRGALWREVLNVSSPPQSVIGHPDRGEDAGFLGLTDHEMEDPLDIVRAAEEAERTSLRGAERKAYEVALKGAVPFDYHAEAYLKAIALAEKTTKERRGLLAMVAKWFTEHGKTLDKIKRREVGRYCTEVLEGLHIGTANKRLGAAKGYWDWLVVKGIVPKDDGNPWIGQIKTSKKRRADRKETDQEEEERAFTDAEVITLLASEWPSQQEAAARAVIFDGIAVGLLSGLRQAEIINLRVGDIEDIQGQFPVIRVLEGKNTSAIRLVPVHSSLLPMVRGRCQGKADSDWFFDDHWAGRKEGKGSAADTFGKAFKRYRLAVGVDDMREGRRRSLVNFHSTRRWFATKAFQANVSTDLLAGVIGHSKKEQPNAMTLRYITGLTDEQRRSVVEAVQLPKGALLALKQWAANTPPPST